MPNMSRAMVLVLASTGFFVMTLNWFDLTSGFSVIEHHFHVGLTMLSVLVSLFLVGYGLFHIPTGAWVRRWGLRDVLVVGLMVESVASGFSGIAPNLGLLMGLRVLAGGGAALVAGAELALVTLAFRSRHLAVAQGITASASYALGALVGLYAWAELGRWWGVSSAMAFGGLIGVAVAGLHASALKRVSLAKMSVKFDTWMSLHRVLHHRNLWWVGIAAMGGYGAYFTVSQLLSGYVVMTFHLSIARATLYGALMLAAGIPGSLLGGYWSDRRQSRKWFILGPMWGLGLLLVVVPEMSLSILGWLVLVMGVLVIFGRPAYTAIPGDDRASFVVQDIATAEGVLFTILAVGGAIVPLVYGYVTHVLGSQAGWYALGVMTWMSAGVGLKMKDVLVLESRPYRSRPKRLLIEDQPSGKKLEP